MSATTWFLVLIVCATVLCLFQLVLGPDPKYRRRLRRFWQHLAPDSRSAPVERSDTVHLTPLRQRLEYLNRIPPGEGSLPPGGERARARRLGGGADVVQLGAPVDLDKLKQPNRKTP